MTTDTLIQVRDLEKHFGDKIHALNGVSTDIRRGEVVVVIGPSGSGKSTFLRCLNLLEMPTGGTITFEGVNLIAKVLFQIPHLNERISGHCCAASSPASLPAS